MVVGKKDRAAGQAGEGSACKGIDAGFKKFAYSWLISTELQ